MTEINVHDGPPPFDLDEVERILVPTDGTDTALQRARQAALRLATTTGAEVVLYDRSDERWTDTPHPTGPIPPEQVDADRRPHLVEQMAAFTDAGVPVSAFLASVPALTALTDALQDLAVDVVVLPDELEHPKMMDRIQVGSSPAEMVERIARLQLDRVPGVVVVDPDGALRLEATPTSNVPNRRLADADTRERNPQ